MTEPATPEDLGEFSSLVATMQRLRDPREGCPWDLQQTHTSLLHSLLEECYEAMEALSSGEPTAMVEELGDLLLHVVFHAQLSADEGAFTIRDVVHHTNEKLRRRHPHVFGDAQVASAEAVKVQWDEIKAEERQAKGQEERSSLDGLPKSMPALAYAQAVQARVARAGLDGVGVGALPQEVARDLLQRQEPGTQPHQEQVLGELLFSLVNTARQMGLEAEEALREANRCFYEQFIHVEARCRERGLSPSALPAEERWALWLREGAEAPHRGP